MESSKVLVIGLDGAPMNLIQKWVDEGQLPTLASFLEEGACGEWESVPSLNSAPAWSSMVTGVNPGKHGVFYFTAFDPYTRSQTYINASHRGAKDVWHRLSEAEKHVIVVNVPVSYPVSPVNGIMLGGLLAPSVDVPGFSWPAELPHELRDHVGEYIIAPPTINLFKMGRLKEALEGTREAIDRRLETMKYLLAKYPWDFSMVVFNATDHVQHYYWHFMEPERFGSTQMEEELHDAILDTYRRLDSGIRELIEIAGKDATVIIVSDHGGMADDGRDMFLPAWLEHMGLFQLKEKSFFDRALSWIYTWLDRNLLRGFKEKIAAAFPALRKNVEKRMTFSNVAWSATQAYTMFSRPEIWVNLVGRDREGIVHPGEEYDALCQHIITELKSAHHYRTGEPLVKRVVRREEAFHGSYAHQAPDLTIQWNDVLLRDVVLGDGTFARELKKEVVWDQFYGLRTGGHSERGIFFIKGPAVKCGQALPTSHLMDFTPTVLYLLGLPIPRELDGQVIREAFEGPTELSFSDSDEHREEPHGKRAYNTAEQELLEERLRNLGYVE